jgi:hypothetical protein
VVGRDKYQWGVCVVGAVCVVGVVGRGECQWTYIHTYISTHTHTYTHRHIHTHIHINTHTHIHTYIPRRTELRGVRTSWLMKRTKRLFVSSATVCPVEAWLTARCPIQDIR